MKDRHRNDSLVQSKDMRELQRRRDRDVILRDLMGTKGQKRIMVDIEQLKIMKKGSVNHFFPGVCGHKIILLLLLAPEI